MQLPGAIEYGAIDPSNMWPFNPYWVFTLNGAPAFDMLLKPDPGVLVDEAEEKQAIYVSRSTTPDALNLIMGKLNGVQEHEKQILLDRIAWLDSNTRMDKTGEVRTEIKEEIAALRFYKPVAGLRAIAADDSKGTTFYVYLENDRIVEARRPTLGSTAKTIEAFLQQYSVREPFTQPAEPGVCLPYGVYRGEQSPASIGATFTVVDQPDIVINVQVWDAIDGVDEPRQMLITQLRGHLAHSTEVLPLDGRVRPSHAVTIDGREGLGHFALVRRKESKPGDKTALDNPFTKDHSDWVYVAYVPGLSGGKPGESFNIQVKIERFGRFAKEPVGKQMTEKQFREFAKRVVEGIHRRPGAWVN
jgi:hypothetical protein